MPFARLREGLRSPVLRLAALALLTAFIVSSPVSAGSFTTYFLTPGSQTPVASGLTATLVPAVVQRSQRA